MSESVEVTSGPEAKASNVEMKVKNYRAYRFVYFVLWFLEVLFILRFFFKLLGANPANVFAIVIYSITSVLLLPFSGLFRGPTVAVDVTARIFEFSTIVAMIVYALIAWGVASWILIFKSKPASKD